MQNFNNEELNTIHYNKEFLENGKGKNHESEITSNNINNNEQRNLLKTSKSPSYKAPVKNIKSPKYSKTPIKSLQVTNFSNTQGTSNTYINETYNKFLINFNPTDNQISQKNNSPKNKKRQISLSNYYPENYKKAKIDNSKIRNHPNISNGTNSFGNSSTSRDSSNKYKKYINITNSYALINNNLSKEPNYGHINNINNFQNQYTNFINSIENTENNTLISPNNKDWNSRNLLSSYMQQNLKFVKNGYSEKLVNIISKKRSNFHIWLHSIQKSGRIDNFSVFTIKKSINVMFDNTVIVEVKQIFIMKCNIQMKCRLIASFHENFSSVYRKEGGKNSLDLYVFTNKDRSWPSQKIIENSKIKILLKDLKNKNTSNEKGSSSSTPNCNFETNEENECYLCEKPIRNGTLLIIKDPKFTLLNPKKTNTISSKNTKILKKSLILYNDLFIIFNI